MSVRIVYRDIAVGAEDDAAAHTSERQPFADPARLPHGAPGGSIATMEPNGWLLDGSRDLLENQRPAFWSVQMSGADRAFETPPFISVELGRLYTSVGISIEFDVSTGDYCSDVTVRWYQGDTLLTERDFAPNRANYFCYCIVEYYDRVDIRFNATHVPFRYARVNHIVFGCIREFRRDELRGVKILERINLISSDVSVNTMDASIDSKSDIAFMFQNFQPMFAYDDDALIGVFYINGSTRYGPGLYDVSCEDAIGLLDLETVPAAIYNGKNAMELAAEILNGRFGLEFAPELENETVTGYIPDGTRRNALHHIAFALRAVVDTSGTENVRFFRPPTGTPDEIPPDRVYTNGNVDLGAAVTSVQVTSHSYSTSGNGKNTVIVDGATYYDTQEVFVINNSSITPSTIPNVIEIKDATLVNPSNVAAVARNAYDYYARRSKHNVKIVMQGELPGDFVTASTLWASRISGSIESMRVTLSGMAAADCEITGSEIH